MQSWDTASKGGPNNDWSVCTTWIMTRKKKWYLIDVWRQRVDYPTLKANVLALAKQFRARRILVEDTGAGVGLVQELKSHVAGIIAVKPEETRQAAWLSPLQSSRQGKCFCPNKRHGCLTLRLNYLHFPAAGMTTNAIQSAKRFWTKTIPS